MDRLIAVGDIHGQLDKLNHLMAMVNPTEKDQFVFLGDYIDRGPDSRGVIAWLIEFRKQYPHSKFLRGNHDQMILDALTEAGIIYDNRLREISQEDNTTIDSFNIILFKRNGGLETLKSYGIKDLGQGIPVEHINFLNGTKLWWQCDPFLFVHAGIEAEIPIEQQDPNSLMWNRDGAPGKNGKIVVVGHSPTADNRPHFDPGLYSLDTGAGHDHYLTACDVLIKHYWQA